jgi:hypothetical protein
MIVKHLEIEDYHNFDNALRDGPAAKAQVSFDCRWKDPIGKTFEVRNPASDQRFAGRFTQTHATVEWSAEEKGFAFRSDPAATSAAVYAEVGSERNGFFFS